LWHLPNNMQVFLLALALWATPVVAITVTAEAWIVADSDGRIIQSVNGEQVRSIASITKLMTTMIVLDSGQPLSQKLGSNTRGELIQLAMIRSDNWAADQLCQHYPGGRTACVMAMNRKADSLRMSNTRFVDPTGLGVMNVSTGQDLIHLVRAARNYSEIRTASQQPWVRIGRQIVYNTNRIVNSDFLVSKTGYIRAAGGCVVMMMDTWIGQRIVILLGSRSTQTRIPEAQAVATLF
jgi:serine-type D-Ala-D-Ala endopeptidase (penicillin-binding protein 7)